MTAFLVLILALAFASGQLIKIPIGSGGITVLDIVIGLFCIAGIIRLKFHLPKPALPVISLLLFAAITILSLVFTPLHLKLSEYAVSFSYSLRFIVYVFFAWLISGGAFRININRTFLLSGVCLAVLGLLQFILYPNLQFLSVLGWDPHYFRTVSTFFDPNFAGGFFVLTLILSFQNLPKDKKWGIFFLILIYLALLTTFSRSSYLMFLASGTTLAYLRRSKSVFIITILLFLGLMLGFHIYSQAVAKPRNIDRSKSATSRLDTWQQGYQLFQKSPFLGIGYNAYRYGLQEYRLSDNSFLVSHGSSSNDSSLLSVLSTTGLVGLSLYIFFLVSLFRISGDKGLIIRAATAGLIVHSFFANSLFYPPILAWILLTGADPKK